MIILYRLSIDCDGQDNIDAMGAMIEQYKNGFEVI